MELFCVQILVSLRHFIICFHFSSVNFKLYFFIDLDFSSHSRIFHSYWDVIIAGKIYSLATHGHWTKVILKRGSENRTERKRNEKKNMECDIHILAYNIYTLSLYESPLFRTIHILAYNIYTLSLYESPLFRTDDVDVLFECILTIQ